MTLSRLYSRLQCHMLPQKSLQRADLLPKKHRKKIHFSYAHNFIVYIYFFSGLLHSTSDLHPVLACPLWGMLASHPGETNIYHTVLNKRCPAQPCDFNKWTLYVTISCFWLSNYLSHREQRNCVHSATLSPHLETWDECICEKLQLSCHLPVCTLHKRIILTEENLSGPNLEDVLPNRVIAQNFLLERNPVTWRPLCSFLNEMVKF